MKIENSKQIMKFMIQENRDKTKALQDYECLVSKLFYEYVKKRGLINSIVKTSSENNVIDESDFLDLFRHKEWSTLFKINHQFRDIYYECEKILINEYPETMKVNTLIDISRDIHSNSSDLNETGKRKLACSYKTYRVESLFNKLDCASEELFLLLRKNINEPLSNCHEAAPLLAKEIKGNVISGYINSQIPGARCIHTWVEKGGYCYDTNLYLVMEKIAFYEFLEPSITSVLTYEELINYDSKNRMHNNRMFFDLSDYVCYEAYKGAYVIEKEKKNLILK